MEAVACPIRTPNFVTAAPASWVERAILCPIMIGWLAVITGSPGSPSNLTGPGSASSRSTATESLGWIEKARGIMGEQKRGSNAALYGISLRKRSIREVLRPPLPWQSLQQHSRASPVQQMEMRLIIKNNRGSTPRKQVQEGGSDGKSLFKSGGPQSGSSAE